MLQCSSRKYQLWCLHGNHMEGVPSPSSLFATLTVSRFVIDCIIMFQLYVLQLCFECFVCFAVRGVIATRRFIENNKCLIGRSHIHRESLSLIVFSWFSCMFCKCVLYALCVLPFAGWLPRFGLYKTTSVYSDDHIYTERVCHWLYSHVSVVRVAIVLCMLCVFCRSWGDCPTSVYTKPIRTASYTQREFVIDYILMF